MKPKTALVLSAGGMFGAWQVGVWKALADRWKPDLVVGTSVGALNAWPIAGDAPPEEIAARWLEEECAALALYCRRWLPWRGVFDPGPLYALIQALWANERPQRDVGVVVVELRRLKPRLFRNEEIRWEQLAASCAVPLCYPPVRIGGKLYTDGGLLSTLPLWAAAEMGATRAIALNALPHVPSRLVRGAVGVLRRLAHPVPAPASLEVTLLTPGRPLGSVRDALFWDRKRIAAWIAQGEADGAGLMP